MPLALDLGTGACLAQHDTAGHSDDSYKEWTYEAARRVQQLITDVAPVGFLCVDRLQDALDRLPSPSSPFEEVILHGLLFEAIMGFTPGGSSDRIASRRAAIVTVFGSVNPTQPTADRRARALAVLAAERLAVSFAEPLSVPSLAHGLGRDQSSIRRAFRYAFGISVREFHARLRIQAAVPMLSGGLKPVAVARMVGYRSDKSFYRVVRELTNMTPSDLARLPRDEIQRLTASLVPGLRPNRLGPVPAV